MSKFWHWLTTSRHTRWLEEEVERLRADRDEARRQIWALVNSLVTTAGGPLPQEILRQATSPAGESKSPAKPVSLRARRSWYQRATAMEIDSARELRRLLHPRGNEPAPGGDGPATQP